MAYDGCDCAKCTRERAEKEPRSVSPAELAKVINEKNKISIPDSTAVRIAQAILEKYEVRRK